MSPLPRYENYKDSGVEWLGEIPSHWELETFKALFRKSNEKNGSTIVGDMLSVSGYRGIEIKRYEHEEQKRTAKQLVDYRVVHPGQLVVNTMWLNYAGLGVSEFEGYVSPAYRAYWISDKLHKRYIHYLLRSHGYIQGYTSQMQGIRPNSLQIKDVDFRKFPILIPSVDEQTRIANFLDQKTAEIDAAIAKKEQLIALLQEQKAILINQAVTKGLNPNAPMKDSGVEWLGEVPSHWEVKKLKYFSTVQSGITLGKIFTGSKLLEYPYLRVANVQYGYFKLDDIAFISLPEKEAKRYFIKPNDILVTEGGDIDKLGRGTVWLGQLDNCLHQNHIFAVRLKPGVVSETFVSLAMASDYGRRYFTTTANKTTNLASTNRTKLGNFPVIVPPPREREDIEYYCENVDTETHKVITLTKNEIKNISELKNTLIAHTVTGKIKV